MPTHTDGDTLFERRGEVLRYTGLVPDDGNGLAGAVTAGFDGLDTLAADLPESEPWRAERAAELDGQSLATWLARSASAEAAMDFHGVVWDTCFAADPQWISLLHALWIIRGAGGVGPFVGTSGGAQEHCVLGGTGNLALRAAEELDGAVRLGCAVSRVGHDPGGVTLTASDGLRVRAQHAVIALSPTLARRISFEPELPADAVEVMQRMFQGIATKTIAVYDTPFWRDDGLSGEATSATGPAEWIYDGSPPDESCGILVGFVTALPALVHARKAEADRRSALLDSFSLLFGPRAASPRSVHEWNWSQEPWSLGCYGGLFPPQALTAVGSALGRPVGRIHWAGTETASAWGIFIEGAIQAGERAAAEVLAERA